MRGRMFGAVLAFGLILAGCEAGQPKQQESLGAQARIGEDVGKRGDVQRVTISNATQIRSRVDVVGIVR